jgi:aspartoacylase
LFLSDSGETIPWEPQPGDPPSVWPLFINEAAYEEKGIALSLTQREAWPVPPDWGLALVSQTIALGVLAPATRSVD